MSMIYARTAAQVPVIQGQNSIIDPVSGNVTAISGSPTTKWPVAATGAMAFAIVSGLELGYSSDNATVSAGQAMFDSTKISAQTATIPVKYLSASRVYFWLSETGQFAQVPDSTTPPSDLGRCLYLGFLNISAGHPASADGSGRVLYSGSVYWRRTGDAGKPADTPLACIQFFNLSQSGIYMWDGSAYHAVNPYDISASSETAPTGDEVILRFVSPRAFTVPAVASCIVGKAGVAATAQGDFSIQKNGVEFAVISWGAEETVGTVTSQAAATFAAGDVLTIVASSTYADATLAKLGITISGLA